VRVLHDHALSLAIALPAPAEVAPPPPVDADPEAVRLRPVEAEASASRSPWQASPPAPSTHAPLVAALHARLSEAARREPTDEVRAALAMSTLLTELDALSARVRMEQRGWLRA
jgi:hypothetical protein